MNNRERLLAALDLRVPDRVPISTYELVGYNSLSFENQDPSYSRLMQVIREETDCICMWDPDSNAVLPKTDHVSDFLETSAHPVEMDVRQERVNNVTITYRTLHTPKGDLTCTTRVVDNVHTVWKTEHWCKSPEDVDKLFSIPYLPVDYDYSDFGRIQGEVGDRGIIMTSVFDPIAWCIELMGLAQSLVWAFTETDHFTRTVEAIQERCLENLKRLLSKNVVDLYRLCGPEVATPPYMPREFFERFVVPYDTALVDMIHRHGSKVRLHCHGKMGTVLDLIAATGADGIDPCEEPPDGDITLAEVKRQVGDRMCLFGSMQLKQLEQASKEEIERTVRNCMAAAKAGGGYVIMPTAAPINTPLSPKTEENYIHYIRTAHECGQY